MIAALPRTAAPPTANQLAIADPLASDLGQIPPSFSDLSGRSSRLPLVVAQAWGQLYPWSLQGELD
jgi:hypothetical protein